MRLLIDIDDKDYELLNKTGIEIDWNTAWHGKEKDREMTFAIFNLAKALKNGTPYEERPQGEWIKVQGEWVTDTVYKICFKCSECDGHFGYPFNFCPNCGAKMKNG